MSRTLSPLRYPGGKACLSQLFSTVIIDNGYRLYDYAEPYAGGCGLALCLLYEGLVSEIHVNDIDPAVWSFWHCVLEHTDELTRLIDETNVTVDEWEKQRQVHAEGDLGNPLSLGFATFFLNRTNRSGVISGAGVIGGKAQSGNYKLDCRYNKQDLKKRICRVQKYRSRIHLYRKDAVDFISSAGSLPDETLFYIDPPYYVKGSKLYTSFYEKEDHACVAQAVTRLDRPWLLTYDDAPEIRELYQQHAQRPLQVGYSAGSHRKGAEVLIHSNNVAVPERIWTGTIGTRSRRATA